VTNSSNNIAKKIFFAVALVFSFYLMWHTFGVDSSGNLQIAAKVRSDFAATIPLIRSFSFGTNSPLEYPIFSGQPIKYHFVFFFGVGMLEKIGLPLDWALNLPSALSFFLLIISIYLLGKTLFGKTSVGILSAILFLFNGSLSFIEFFRQHPITSQIFSQAANSDTFASFGPYDDKIVSAFWNLNIYTNQRHLAFAYAIFIFLVIYIYKKRANDIHFTDSLVLGVMIGLFPFVHMAVFGMIVSTLGLSIILFPNKRKPLFLSLVVALTIALPQIIYLKGGVGQQFSFVKFGYLVESLSITNFLKYWLLNIGLVAILTPVGFLLSNVKQRKIFLIFFGFFIIGNIFQFSPEIAANHKFFNLFIIGSNVFVSYVLVTLWNKGVFTKLTAISLFVFLTLSGLLDFFPIINDHDSIINDKQNETVNFIKNNTPGNAVFLNTSYLYNEASLAGRKIYLGWPYFPWSAGYDTFTRSETMSKLLNPQNKVVLCNMLKKEKITHLEIKNPHLLEDITVNYKFFEDNFFKIFSNQIDTLNIYETDASCADV